MGQTRKTRKSKKGGTRSLSGLSRFSPFRKTKDSKAKKAEKNAWNRAAESANAKMVWNRAANAAAQPAYLLNSPMFAPSTGYNVDRMTQQAHPATTYSMNARPTRRRLFSSPFTRRAKPGSAAWNQMAERIPLGRKYQFRGQPSYNGYNSNNGYVSATNGYNSNNGYLSANNVPNLIENPKW